MKKLLLVLALPLLLLACDEADHGNAAIPVPTEKAISVPPGVKHPGILPAYKLPGEDYVPGKQDAASDYRKLHPQWYAITVPPPASYRPMKEWEPMVANMITYSNYLPGDKATAKTMADIVVHSIPVGEVWVVVTGAAAKADLEKRLKDSGITDQQIAEKIKYFNIDNDAIWTIDFGPLPMVDDVAGKQIWQDFRYYHQRYLDDAIPTRLANAVGVTTYRSPFDFEGGNFQADGEEFCYTTERLYYYTGLDYDGVNAVFKKYYGCKKAVVLKDITDDGTGHVDMFFKLGKKKTAFMGEYTTVNDPTNKKRMDDNVGILEALTFEDGSGGMKVYRIPFPNPGGSGSNKTPRTYINSTLFVSADGSKKVNLWPTYTVDKDLEAQALAAWEEGLPGWDHIGIISDQISLYSGAIHCVTRTIPALPLAPTIADGNCVDGACDGGDDGYDGACIAATEPDPGCWGPKWECLCNHCDAAGCAIPASCGDGTCGDKENCFNCAQDCTCGVDTVCNVVTGQCVSNTCGNGQCDEGENCLSCVPDCGCKGGQACAFGICTDDPCGGITYDGCCDGPDTLVYCEDDDLVVQECQGAGCGWLSDKKWYDCTGKGADPSGELPLDCHEFSYPPGCDGKECGDNGGGYSCGECGEGTECVEGKCAGGPQCSCEGKACGDDGCGTSCGECDEGFTCEEGQCVEEAPVCSCEGKECGDDGCGVSCGECAAGFDCEAGKCIDNVMVEGGEGDVVAEPDQGIGADDLATEPDEKGEEPTEKKKDDGGCSTTDGPGSSSGLALLALLALLGMARRRVTA